MPVVVRLGGSAVSNTVTMAIDPKGAPCTDPADSLGAIFRAGGKFGAALLVHDNLQFNVDGAAQSYTADYGSVSLRQEAGGAWAFNPYVSLPPVGTCTAYGIAGEFGVLNDAPGLAASVKDLNGGASLSIAGSAGTVSLPQGTTSPVLYSALFAASEGLPGVLPSFFTPGTASSLAGTGGSDVGPFQTTVTTGADFTWTNQAAVTSVTRSAGLTITWSNVPTGAPFVSIIGYNVDQANNVSGGFQCLASASASSFTVPAVALRNVPATPAGAPANMGWISVGVPFLGSSASFTAAGLDAGVAVFGTGNQQAVTFQ